MGTVCPEGTINWGSIVGRAQPDITSGPEVRQFFKCPDSGLPVFFLPGLNTLKTRKRIKKRKKKFQKFFFKIFFPQLFLFIYMLKISPDSVRSGRTCPANLGVRSCPVRKLICPVRSSPSKLAVTYGQIDIFNLISLSLIHISEPTRPY